MFDRLILVHKGKAAKKLSQSHLIKANENMSKLEEQRFRSSIPGVLESRSASRPWLGFNRNVRHYDNGSILLFLQLKVSSMSKQLSSTHHKRSGSFMANALSFKAFLFCEHCFSLLLKRHIKKLCLYFLTSVAETQ